jgi:glucan phosphoethanolaminetransferase (alkaline phosphatase superfamily)
MKRFIRITFLITFFLVIVASGLLIIKPGASIFYIKRSISPENVKPYKGYAYHLPITLNSLLFPPGGVLLSEDTALLNRTNRADVIQKGLGKYSITVQENNRSNLIFSAKDNSDPTSNGRQYTLYLHLPFLSRKTGASILLISIFGLALFARFAIKSLARGESSLASPQTIWQLFNEFLDEELPRVIIPIKNTRPIKESRRSIWIFLLTLTTGAAFFYVFMEWFFFVTKSSFMDLMGWVEKIEILLFTSFVLILASLVLVLIAKGLDLIISKFLDSSLPIFIATLIPSFILAAISLLLVDNFTYTIFNFGIVSTSGAVRYAYGVGFLIIFFYINTRILTWMGLRGQPDHPIKIPRLIFVLIAVLFVITAGLSFNQIKNAYSNPINSASDAGNDHDDNPRPNILLIISDGLNATNMSLYGYERDTTPVLKELSKSSLLAENAFTNSSNSTGSTTSMLTGKPPAQTRVLLPPNILQGDDVSQHLPAILRSAGYYTAELAVPNYVDANAVNLLDGFTEVNGHVQEESQVAHFTRRMGFGNSLYFASLISKRITERLLHIFFIREMENPFSLVTQPVKIQRDEEQVNHLIELIQDTEEPLFAFVHLMGTHGPRFVIDQQKFSTSESLNENWDPDIYDDSILTFDSQIGRLLAELEKSGEMDNTLLFIFSDHPMHYNVRWRIPLLMHFPNDDFSGTIKTNVQILDIPPTILDYLGIDQPEWMQGHSLLQENRPENELIFSTGTVLTTRNEQKMWVVDSANVKPPFYQFSFFNIVNCDKWYFLDINNLTWDSGDVPEYTKACSDDQLLTQDQIYEALLEYLSANGFDTSTIPKP